MIIEKVLRLTFSLILGALLLVSCYSPDPQEISDSILIYYNNGAFQKGNQITAGSGLSMSILNRSDYCLVFPYDYAIRMYLKKDSEDIEVSNTVEYIFLENAPIFETIEAGSQGSVLIAPDLTNIVVNDPKEFRATITGHLCDDETIEITKEFVFFVVP